MKASKRKNTAVAATAPRTRHATANATKSQSEAGKPVEGRAEGMAGQASEPVPAPKLRFAALRRVSTERQEKEGESLNGQKAAIERAVTQLGGDVVAWYGGREHATPGFEKKELTRLITDAQHSPKAFDAVIVAHADRWSRDNSASRHGLEIFKSSGIRFFVDGTEYDLFNPEHELFLALSAVIGQFQARQQSKKSIDMRIQRARKGVPTSGKLPFGRTFGKTGWGVDAEKKHMVEAVAQRYLAGEPMEKLAEEYDVNLTNLHKVLTRVSGTKWQIRFDSNVLNIHEVVELQIPRLLDDAVINAVKAKMAANRTFFRQHIKNHYLLGRAIVCEHCGYAVSGQTNHNGRRYYRHLRKKRDKICPGPSPKAWIRADELEDNVMRHLFETFGNAPAVAKAIKDAMPDDEKVREAQREYIALQQNLAKAKAGLHRVLGLVAKGLITDADAEAQIKKSKNQIQHFETRQARLTNVLTHLPSAAEVKQVAERISGKFRRYTNAKLWAKTASANEQFESMTYEEKRQLCELVFCGEATDGRRMGVRVEWADGGKKWKYRLSGRFIEETGPVRKDGFQFGAPEHQKNLLVTKNASY